jgi:hypothetical protein
LKILNEEFGAALADMKPNNWAISVGDKQTAILE